MTDRVTGGKVEAIRTLSLWFEQQIENAQQDQISGFAARSNAGTLRGERAHARHCAMYEAQQMFLAAVADINRPAQRASKFSPGDPVEVRKQNDQIDEIVIRRSDVHIEQMSGDSWFMGIDASDGSYWQFWFGAKNRKSHVEFRHTETVGASEQAESPALPSTDRSTPEQT